MDELRGRLHLPKETTEEHVAKLLVESIYGRTKRDAPGNQAD
jgi:hypothetical protein